MVGPSASQFRVLSIERISESLFAERTIRKRLCRDYGIEDIGDPVKMADSLVRSMGQVRSCESGTEYPQNNRTVFRAAALALASNMRQWSGFLSRRSKFESLLEQYDPIAFSRAVEVDSARIRDVANCLGGQTARGDTNAMVMWARMLAEVADYFNALKELKRYMQAGVDGGEIVPIVAALLGSPRKRLEKQRPPPSGMESWKAPGMGIVLASEFLRNLHWEAFKPDRHINRLLGRWFPEVVRNKSARAEILAREILYCESKDVITGLKYSLVGMAVTPHDCNFTKADNLVWALGAYVERKNRESDEVYWKTVAAR